MDCWDNLSDLVKFKFLITMTYIDNDVKQRLWDIITVPRQLAIWHLSKSVKFEEMNLTLNSAELSQ